MTLKIIPCVILFCSRLIIYALAFSAPSRSVPKLDTFDAFVEMRTGLGTGNGANDMVFWTGEGQLYDSPSGEILANVDGFDVSRGVKMDDGSVRQFSRKIFWFRDPKTNEIMKEFNGKAVKPIKYDWQVFDYNRGENKDDPAMATILPSVLKGPRLVPCMPIVPKYAGSEQVMYECPLFIDIEGYQAWEFYVYCSGTAFDENRPASASWSRQGPTPPFDDKCGVMHFISHRLTSFEDLPERSRILVEEEFPLYKEAPLDMKEVERLESALVNGYS